MERNDFGMIQTLEIDGSNGTFDDINIYDNFISFEMDFNNNKEDICEDAHINLCINPDSQIALFQFLINKVFQTITTEDFSYIENHIIFALFDKEILRNDDRLLQWEISFHTYKQYFEQFDLDYLIKYAKTQEEDLSSFLFKIRFLIDTFLQSDAKEGSEILYLNSSKSTATSAVNIGNSSTRLPFGTFTKYK